jgi:hypothetical protein
MRERFGAAVGVITLTVMVVALPAAPAAAAPERAADPWQSWSYDGFWGIDRTLADPGPLSAADQVVVYATTGRHCILSTCTTSWVPRFTSTSLGGTAGLQGDALPSKPDWVSPTDRVIWAPSVAEIGGFHVMYFAATAGPGATNAGLKCIGTAVATSADGPFMPMTTALACGRPGYWAIDPYLVADGADIYLLWREDDPANVLGKIVAARLGPDGVSLAGTGERTTLVVGQYPWEDGSPAALAAAPDGTFDRSLPPGAGGVDSGIGPIENPAMARHPATGEWLLTWSANSWNTQAYATGLAVCETPLGPCERLSHEQPWLRSSGDGSITTTAVFGGTGGLAFLTGPDGRLYAVFHAYRGTGDASNALRICWIYQVVRSAGGYRLAEF